MSVYHVYCSVINVYVYNTAHLKLDTIVHVFWALAIPLINWIQVQAQGTHDM